MKQKMDIHEAIWLLMARDIVRRNEDLAKLLRKNKEFTLKLTELYSKYNDPDEDTYALAEKTISQANKKPTQKS